MSDTRSDEIETTIGQLPANGTLADTDAIPTEKSGGSGVKTTLAQIKTFIQNAFNSVFAKKTDLDDYAKSSDLSSYAKTSDVADAYETKANASSTYATKTEIENFDVIKNVITNVSGSETINISDITGDNISNVISICGWANSNSYTFSVTDANLSSFKIHVTGNTGSVKIFYIPA